MRISARSALLLAALAGGLFSAPAETGKCPKFLGVAHIAIAVEDVSKARQYYTRSMHRHPR
jgi:hypothetical protein